MKYVFFSLIFLFQLSVSAQEPCELETNIKDSLGSYKATKQYILYEHNYSGNVKAIFFSLSENNGIKALDFQFLQQSNNFIPVNCFDKKSKIFLQLRNGKIISLIYAGEETCGSFLLGENNKYNRILSGTFIILKKDIEDLKSSPVTFMRVNYTEDLVDYPFRTNLISELNQKTYEPENFFMDYLKCIED